MKLTEDDVLYYRAILSILKGYFSERPHTPDEQDLFAFILVRLLIHEGIPLVKMVDLWEECVLMPGRTTDSFYKNDLIETLPPVFDIVGRKTEPLS